LDQEEDQIVSICLSTLPAFGRQALESKRSKRVRLDFRRRLKDLPHRSGDYSCPSSFRVNLFQNIARISAFWILWGLAHLTQRGVCAGAGASAACLSVSF
jgi:hypothetical protein